MVCPYLEYAEETDEPDRAAFDEPRAFCTVIEEFVQPMRADICNDRYDLHHEYHCEIYREHTDGKDEHVEENSE